jgi:DNA polymerase III delta prime subunit
VSRTQSFHVVPPNKAEVGKHAWNILQKEGISANVQDVKIIIDAHYPDIRKVIQEIQQNSTTGQLLLNKNELVASDIKLQIIETLVAKSDGKTKFQSIRQILADAKIRDFSDIYRLLYDRVEEYSPNNVSGVILAIAEGQYRDAFVVDKEINMMSTLISILQVMK